MGERTKVGFPNTTEPKKSGNGKIVFLIVIILLILGGASWYLFSREEETIEFTNDTITPVVSNEEPTQIEEKKVEKSTLKLRVLNGTGTPGDAGKLEKALNDLGYSEVTTGNADNYDYKTAEVTFSEGFPENYKEEIMEALKKLYTDVKEGNETLGENNVVLITGSAKGAKSVVTATPTSKVTPTVKLTTTPTPALTVTPTP